MSSKQRRRKSQIARLVKLDANYGWLYYKTSSRRDGLRALDVKQPPLNNR